MKPTLPVVLYAVSTENTKSMISSIVMALVAAAVAVIYKYAAKRHHTTTR